MKTLYGADGEYTEEGKQVIDLIELLMEQYDIDIYDLKAFDDHRCDYD